MLGRTRTIHIVGIGGIGMSGIAELLANLGYAAMFGRDEQSILGLTFAQVIGDEWIYPNDPRTALLPSHRGATGE